MKKLKVKDLVFNEGRPKICASIVGKTEEEIFDELEVLKDIDFDLIEWRADHYNKIEEFSKVQAILKRINKLNKALVFTLRSKEQGGARELPKEIYFSLNHFVIQSGLIDLIDIELLQNQEQVKIIVKEAKNKNVKVIISDHDFNNTHPKEEILKRLYQMQSLGSDINKIALMAENEKDVLTLLEAALEMKKFEENQPTIIISMGNLGKISRIAGELFGSCMTYGPAKKPSAPGQIGVRDLREILDLLNPLSLE